MKSKDEIAVITSDTDDKKVSMSLSDMQKLMSTVLKKQRKKGKRWKKAEADDEDENYLLPQDIENIITVFAPLEHLIKNEEGKTPETFGELICGLIENAIYTRVRDLSLQRKTEKLTEFASAEARDSAFTPRYTHPWYKLFRRTPNRAMKLILERERQAARLEHLQQQIQNDELRASADELEKAYKNSTVLPNADEEPEEENIEEPEEENAEADENTPELPKRKRRVKSSEADVPTEDKDE